MTRLERKHIVLFILFFGSFLLKGQEEIRLEGRIISASNDVTAVHVSNITKNKGTITDFGGYFEISVQLGDSLVFSAVQFKRKEVVVTPEILNTALFVVSLEDMLTELNEVIVTPYNLSGELERDLFRVPLDSIITASTEGLPNAYVKPPSQSQRKLYTARTWDAKFYLLAFTSKLDPLFNYFSGRTKMLNERVERDAKMEQIERVRKFYADSLYINDLQISKTQINQFIYFCEQDSLFTSLVETDDKLKLWEFFKFKSTKYIDANEKF